MVTSFLWNDLISEWILTALFTTKFYIFPINNELFVEQERLRIVLTLDCSLIPLNCRQILFFLHEWETNIYTNIIFSDCSKLKAPRKQKQSIENIYNIFKFMENQFDFE